MSNKQTYFQSNKQTPAFLHAYMLPACQQPCIQSNNQTANTRSHTHSQDKERTLVRWPAGHWTWAGGSWELEQRSGCRSWSCSAAAPAQEQNIGRQGQWSRTPDTGSLRVDWPSCWRRAAAWGRGRRSCRRGERGRRAAALASSSRIGKWLPWHFARYAETWRNRQTLGCWAVAGYRLTACAASRDVGNFGQLG
jgi:hypothetical protein